MFWISELGYHFIFPVNFLIDQAAVSSALGTSISERIFIEDVTG